MQLQCLHQTRPVHHVDLGGGVSRGHLHSLTARCKPSASYLPTAVAAEHVALRDSSMPQTPCHAAQAGASLARQPGRGRPGLTDQSEQSECVTLAAQHAGQQLDLSAANPTQPR